MNKIDEINIVNRINSLKFEVILLEKIPQTAKIIYSELTGKIIGYITESGNEVFFPDLE